MINQIMKGLLVLFSCSFFSACTYDKSKEKPFAMGESDQLIVIVDDELKRTNFSDSIWWYLTPPIAGLPQPEDKLKVNVKSYSQLERADDLITRYRNLMFVVITSKPSKLASVVMNTPDSTFLKESNQFFNIQRDVYAVNQQLFTAKAPTIEAFVEQLKVYAPSIISRVKKFDEVRYATALYTTGNNKKSRKKLDSIVGLKWEVPVTYRPLMSGKNSFAFGRTQTYLNQKDQTERVVNQRIVAARIPVSDNRIREIFNEKDSLGRVTGIYPELRILNSDFAQGVDELSFVEEDLRSYWTTETVEIAGKNFYLNRNLWRVSNPVMGGPMLVYYTYLPETKELLIIECIIYGAGGEKAPLVREIEAIVNNLETIYTDSPLKS